MTIPTLPTAPSRGQAPDAFALQADAFVAALPAWGVAVQAVGDAADADAAAAAISAAAAAASASTANYKGVYSAGTTYQIGQSVTYGAAKFFAKTINLAVTPVDGANWGLVNEVPSQTGNAGKFLKTNGATPSWEEPVPPQAGHAGKFLSTDASTSSWQPLTTLSAMLKGNGAGLAAAVANSDYLPATNPSITGAITEDVFTITDGASIDLSPANGTMQFLTLGASRTLAAPGAWNDGEGMTLHINDGTAYSLTWTNVLAAGNWIGGSAPTLATSGWAVVELWKAGGTIRGCFVGSAT